MTVSTNDFEEIESAESDTVTLRSRHRVGVRREIYTRLQQASKTQGKPITELVADALETYLTNTDS